MHPSPMYDAIADEYLEFARQASDPTTIIGLARQTLMDLVGDIRGRTICDLGCGEGHLTRLFSERSAELVIGVDISMPMLGAARIKGHENYILSDAQSLDTLAVETFDIVVSNLALMDIPDLVRSYQAVSKVLKDGGRFVFSIMHPCFQSPQTRIEANGRLITTYTTEGQWFSEGTGIRAKVGAYHRTMATYINLLVETGFMIHSIVEPTLPPDAYAEMSQNIQIEIPSIMVIKAVK